MSAIYKPQVITASSVKDGNTVYLTTCDAWTPDIEIAEFLAEEDLEWRLAFARRLREVANANLAEVPDAFLQQTAAA